jgi:hypothetical protein
MVTALPLPSFYTCLSIFCARFVHPDRAVSLSVLLLFLTLSRRQLSRVREQLAEDHVRLQHLEKAARGARDSVRFVFLIILPSYRNRYNQPKHGKLMQEKHALLCRCDVERGAH